MTYAHYLLSSEYLIIHNIPSTKLFSSAGSYLNSLLVFHIHIFIKVALSWVMMASEPWLPPVQSSKHAILGVHKYWVSDRCGNWIFNGGT